MSFLNSIFKKLSQLIGCQSSASKKNAECNTLNSTEAINQSFAPASIAKQVPEIDVHIADEGRTLIFLSNGFKKDIANQTESLDVSSSVETTQELPVGITADLVQQLLAAHEQVNISQAAADTKKTTFSPFVFRMTCSRCKVNGEIDEYVATFICPMCGGQMSLQSMHIKTELLNHHDTVKIVAELWKKQSSDPSAKHQWDLLASDNNPDVVNLLAYVSRNENVLSAQEESLSVKQEAAMPVFTKSALLVAPQIYSKVLSKQVACRHCYFGVTYPEILEGVGIECPRCGTVPIYVPGKEKKYYASARITRNEDFIENGIFDMKKMTVCSLQDISSTFRSQLDVCTTSYKFDMHRCFDEHFFMREFDPNELGVFSFIKTFFAQYAKKNVLSDVKIAETFITVIENSNKQTILFPNIVVQRNSNEVSCIALDSVLLSINEWLKPKLDITSSRTTWLHTRVDGGPDRRYSYNPQKKIPLACNLIPDISCRCTLKIGSVSWDITTKETVATEFNSLIREWNALTLVNE